jgi:flagellar biosynthesis chaperone FliJ
VALKGYNYNWIDQNKSQDKQIGLLAQEVKQVLPDLVREDKNGTLSVNYQGMVPVLVEAIKEQQKQIDEQNKKIDTLLLQMEAIINKK